MNGNQANEENARIRPPKTLIFNVSGMSMSWRNWIQQFEWYSTATQLTRKIQLQHLWQQLVIQIFNNFNLSDE